MTNKEQTPRQPLPSLTGGGRGWVFLTRMKGYTILSLLGLIISLSGTVIISRYLYQEWTMDHFMHDLDRTYILKFGNGDYGSFPANYKLFGIEQLASHFEGRDELEAVASLHVFETMKVTMPSGEVLQPGTIGVDSMFLDLYPLRLADGTGTLTGDDKCLLSEKLAAQLFPNKRAVGQTLTLNSSELRTIVGVFRQPETKTSLSFDLICSETIPNQRNSVTAFTILRFRPGTDIQAYNAQLSDDFDMGFSGDRTFKFSVHPYSQGFLDSEYQKAWSQNYVSGIIQLRSNPHYLWLLLVVAILLLGVGLFNFVNLFAVMRSHRRHELHVRRLFGASRWDLFRLLYYETFVLALLAMVGVWTVVELTTPLLATYYNIEVMGQWKFDVALTAVIIIILPLVGPSPLPLPCREGSNYLSRIKRATSQVHLTPLPTREGQGGGSAGGAAAFLFLQFFISLTLTTASIYLMRQLHVMMKADPGYRTENILSCMPFPDRNEPSMVTQEWYDRLYSDSRLLRDRLNACPHIKSYVTDPYIMTGGMPIKANDHNITYMQWNPKLQALFGLQMAEGRTFNDTIDQDEQYRCIVNETAARLLGIRDIRRDKVDFDQRLWQLHDEKWHTLSEQPLVPYEVVGIMRDFHPGRMSEPQPAIVFVYQREDQSKHLANTHLLLDVLPGHEQEAIDYMKATVSDLFQSKELPCKWLTEMKADLYREDRRTARIFITFSLLAIAVTCLGVLGLMLFDVRRRYREIALRKVHGATFLDIALLLSRRYLIVFAVAAVASLPVSLLVIHRLMASYTIHTSFAWWIPLMSITLILGLCALTLWQQVWRATRIKPYQILKEQ
ncbi:MAG: ABC transporter permease [Bacteroidaceae bacterium]|nr:ABC transporter permease [Bacteroidaceae bacterium]